MILTIHYYERDKEKTDLIFNVSEVSFSFDNYKCAWFLLCETENGKRYSYCIDLVISYYVTLQEKEKG